MNVSEAIRTKRAVRQFEPRPLPEQAVLDILHAGRRAQSSKNTQPWHFVAVRQRDTLAGLAQMGDYAGHLAGAALGVVLVSAEPGERWWIMFDLGQCAAYMQLAAWELGIGSCLASIYEPERAGRLLGVPEHLACHMALSFGYPLGGAQALAPRKPSAAGRRPLADVVHWEKW
jgi:nitroreductase